ncbi:preprotein translocase subunit SecG [Paenibacillus jamilae]|uniref:Uncharacterized protein n=1 Tax=Paenibacillus polymyxa TaxID=1406 RepID=A0A378XQR9_PAEPO|nr:hypothetical protein [Paenibacillus polymyxa]MDP9678887.1 preprotein translocase subunit SecG [Paenibacillus jamilae]MBE7900440.1 hypothetical protein [Paenibacillus polymyxa]MBG9766078.1 hypothetical protein [Paenibacillus polymyxa]MCC3260638.1 hypothetical protein [Paenibacillus polymyxa]QDA26302.1 hypothetical protein FGY93_04560 [Paenibacillus polymyxa]
MFSMILTYSIQTIVILLIIFTVLRNNRKKIGQGSLSLLLSLLGMAVSFEFGDYIFGDQLLSFLGMSAWSNPVNNTGFHYTIFVSSIFFIPSLIIGYKNSEDFGALIGRRVSSIYLFIIIISLLFFIISCLSK